MYALECPSPANIKWKYSTGSAKVDSTAALSSGRDSVFRLAVREPTDRVRDQPGGVDATQNPAGSRRALWTYGPTNASLSPVGGFLTIAADGIIYVAMGNGIYALQPNSGVLLWRYLSSNGIISGAALGKPIGDSAATSRRSGTAVLYFGSQDHKVYAIKSKRTGPDPEQSPRSASPDSPGPVGPGRNGGHVQRLDQHGPQRGPALLQLGPGRRSRPPGRSSITPTGRHAATPLRQRSPITLTD